MSKPFNFELTQFIKESAVAAGFPIPYISSSGACAAVQYASTVDVTKAKSIAIIDFGELNTCLHLVNFSSVNKKNIINVSGSYCTHIYSGRFITEKCADLIVKSTAKKQLDPELGRKTIIQSASSLKEKLTSNEYYMMAVQTISFNYRSMKVIFCPANRSNMLVKILIHFWIMTNRHFLISLVNSRGNIIFPGPHVKEFFF